MTPSPTAAEWLEQATLQYPETTIEHPWGHPAAKVRGKGFAYWHAHEGSFSFSAKLPVSAPFALSLPFTSPTGYGLGKAGWVSARFEPGDEVPVPLLLEWLDESYRAIAPKKLVQSLKP